MASSGELKKWIYDNSGALHLELLELNWPKRFHVPLSDFEVRINIGEKVYSGRGTSRSIDEAIFKGFSEAVERFAKCRWGFESSNGMAAHPDFEIASRNAKNELIERDIFMCHFLTETPFTYVNDTIGSLGDLAPILSHLESKNLDINFFTSGSECRGFYVLCVIKGDRAPVPFGITLGSAIRETFEESIMTAFLEAARHTFFLLEVEEYRGISMGEFLSHSYPTFELHGQAGLALEYLELTRGLFSQEESQKAAGKLDFKFNVFEIDVHKSLPGLPLHIVRAESNEVQSLYLGQTTSEKVNFLRLQDFVGPSREVKVNSLIHPFR